MKAVAIGGVPATGKSTLMKHILKKAQVEKKFAYGLLRGYIVKDTAFLGLYPSGDKFGGTDKLSMAVQRDYDKFVDEQKYNIVFEGDRLFTAHNLLALQITHEHKIIILENNAMTLAHRHIDREDTQSEKFLKGRTTKIKNIKENEFISYEPQELTTLEETAQLADDILEFLELGATH
jgi:hypothetical protein